MSRKIPVGLLGGGGLVGQEYVRLLQDHPQFELVYRASRETLEDYSKAKGCEFIFSALPSDVAESVELEYAKRGFTLFSSASCHRNEGDIPLIIPEINQSHLEMIPMQQNNRGWDRGCIIAKPNCTLQSYLLPLMPLHRRFTLEHFSVCNLQAVSGAGAGYKLEGNIIPWISGEEEKSESEPLKIFGEWDGKILRPSSIVISARCTRVPVEHGHLAIVSAKFKERPSLSAVLEEWEGFKGLDLFSSPKTLLSYFEEEDRPQPQLDHHIGNGMSIALGGLKECPIFDIRFTALSHNLIRGAAGGGILTAELYVEKLG